MVAGEVVLVVGDGVEREEESCGVGGQGVLERNHVVEGGRHFFELKTGFLCIFR